MSYALLPFCSYSKPTENLNLVFHISKLMKAGDEIIEACVGVSSTDSPKVGLSMAGQVKKAEF